MFKELRTLFSDNPDKAKILPTKAQSKSRWIILILSCLMLVGSYYCFDIPAALKSQIDDFFGNPRDYETNFSLLYSLYAFPNVILPFFGGYFVDRFGVRLCMLVFAALITLGQIVFCIGISAESWPILFVGRFIFGLGGESLTVAISALLADWFGGKELAFAFGLNLSIARLGSVINNILSPLLTQTVSLEFSMWFGAMVCGFSLLTVILSMPIDKAFDDLVVALDKIEDSDVIREPLLLDNENDKIHEDSRHSVPVEASGSAKGHIENSSDKPPEAEIKDVLKLSHIFWVLVLLCVVVYGCVLPFNNIASSLLLERDYFIENPSDCMLETYGCQSNSNEPVASCPSSKWYQPPLPYNVTVDGKLYSQVTSDDVDCTSEFWSGDGACTHQFCSRLASSQKQAALIMSIPYIISSVLSPIVGIGVDLYGMRAAIATFAPISLIAVHIYLAYTRVSPIGPLVGQGLAYTGFASVLWPAIPLVVEERFTGLAFGIATAFLNLACAVFPIIIAGIFNNAGDKYIPKVEVLFIYLAVIGSIVGLYCNFYDYKYLNSVLNRGSKNAAPVDALGGAGQSGDSKDITNVVSSSGSVTTYSKIHEHSDRKNSKSSDASSLDLFDPSPIVQSPDGGSQLENSSSSSNTLDGDGWKYNYENRRSKSGVGLAAGTLEALRGDRDRLERGSQDGRNVSVDNLSNHSQSSVGSSSLRNRRSVSKDKRTRGSSFTAYDEIHKGGGI